jgi:hypothetical protein
MRYVLNTSYRNRRRGANEGIQMAALTKTDIAAIRKADQISIHLNERNPAGRVVLIKRKKYNAAPFETDQEYPLDSEVRLETTRGRDALERGAATCFELVYIYHNQNTPVSSILKTLRAGDEIAFCFHPDYHTNGYVADAGLHADSLLLRVNRNGKYFTYELENQVCPDNSARMIRGVPNDSSYQRMADDRRANA